MQQAWIVVCIHYFLGDWFIVPNWLANVVSCNQLLEMQRVRTQEASLGNSWEDTWDSSLARRAAVLCFQKSIPKTAFQPGKLSSPLVKPSNQKKHPQPLRDMRNPETPPILPPFWASAPGMSIAFVVRFDHQLQGRTWRASEKIAEVRPYHYTPRIRKKNKKTTKHGSFHRNSKLISCKIKMISNFLGLDGCQSRDSWDRSPAILRVPPTAQVRYIQVNISTKSFKM